MTEHLGSYLRRRMLLFCRNPKDQTCRLAIYLQSVGDRRADDVREFAAVPIRRVTPPSRAPFKRIFAGTWWEIWAVPWGVSMRILPGTVQFESCRQYGTTTHLVEYQPIRKILARLPDEQDVEVRMTRNELRMEFQFALAECSKARITLQFGFTPMEIYRRERVAGERPAIISTTIQEYEQTLPYKNALLHEYDLAEQIMSSELYNPELPDWLLEIHHRNPGRFWWWMKEFFESEGRAREIACLTMEKLRPGWDGSVPEEIGDDL